MLGLLSLVVSVALADALNPGTILPALYLAAQPRPYRNLFGFGAGILLVNVAGGLALAFVLGRAAKGALPHPGANWTHALELAGGVVLVIGSFVLWRLRDGIRRRAEDVKPPAQRAALLAGLTIGIVEFPTAVPYFAVVAAIAAAEKPFATDIALLVLFNVIFLLPVPLIAAARALAGPQVAETLRRQVLHHAGTVLAALVFVVGIGLIVLGAVGLA